MIQFRFPGGRWEPIPPGYTEEQARLLYANYDLKLDGEIILVVENNDS